MAEEWDRSKLQSLIDDGIEERQDLEYKAAAALQKTDEKKREISKDVSAMANASGGTIIYGVAESQQHKSVPATLDAVRRSDCSADWLSQVINGTIEPRITGVRICTVELDDSESVAYVVEIPLSDTAHQASTLKYHRRWGTECLEMRDHEIRDVMNRRKVADARVEFVALSRGQNRGKPYFTLSPKVTNHGSAYIQHFQLEIDFPERVVSRWTKISPGQPETPSDNIVLEVIVTPEVSGVPYTKTGGVVKALLRSDVLFPGECRDLGSQLKLPYAYDPLARAGDERPEFHWTLYADDMPRKEGTTSIPSLHGG